jgi:hypothetical protein
MAFDDGAQFDPATFPENIKLMQEINARLDGTGETPKLISPPMGDMHDLLIEALSATVEQVPAVIAARSASHPREDDLRTTLALNLARTEAAVFTEAKLKLPGWTPNLGGSDILVVGTDGGIVLAETKWGSVWQSLWDILKLASGHQHPRVSACYAVYAATPKEWATQACAQYFEPDQDASWDTNWLLEEHADGWKENLAGSPNVHVTEIPRALGVKTVFARAIDCLGMPYEVRAVSVSALDELRIAL